MRGPGNGARTYHMPCTDFWQRQHETNLWDAMGSGAEGASSSLRRVPMGDMPLSNCIREIPVEGPRNNYIKGMADAVADKKSFVARARTLRWEAIPNETGYEETKTLAPDKTGVFVNLSKSNC